MSPPPTLDPDTLAAIALAEGQREMLQHLAEWGMALSKDICQRSIDSPYHPELKHDPGRAFAAASRAVRLTLAMQARVQKEIVALRNGVTPAPAPPAPDAATDAADFVAAEAAGQADEARDGARDDADAAARESIEREGGDVDEARAAARSIRERLIEGEDFQDILDGGIDACLDTIRAELGLDPLPSRPREGPLSEVERGGEGRAKSDVGDDPHVPTPDVAALRLDPPQVGEEGAADPVARSAGFLPALLL